jgi:hypothetical protein
MLQVGATEEEEEEEEEEYSLKKDGPNMFRSVLICLSLHMTMNFSAPITVSGARGSAVG